MSGIGQVGGSSGQVGVQADDAAAPADATPEAAVVRNASAAPGALPAGRPVITGTPPPDVPATTAAAPATVSSIADVQEIVKELIDESFPELRGASFDVKPFQSDAYYFESSVKPASIFFGDLKYVVEVNPKVFGTGIPRDAAKAILAHELSHTAYYQTHGRLGLLETGVAQLTDSLGIPLERRTDLEAISRGYGPGLIEYRNWIYQHIPPADVAEKKRLYFGPDEIQAIMDGSARFPDLMAKWKANPPRDLATIESDISARAAAGPG